MPESNACGKTVLRDSQGTYWTCIRDRGHGGVCSGPPNSPAYRVVAPDPDTLRQLASTENRTVPRKVIIDFLAALDIDYRQVAEMRLHPRALEVVVYALDETGSRYIRGRGSE